MKPRKPRRHWGRRHSFGGGHAGLGLVLFVYRRYPQKLKQRLPIKITSYFCDLCGSAIPTELVDDVKGLNIRVDLDHGAYESFVFQHACLNCRNSVRTVLVEWRDKHKKAAQT